MAATDTVPRLGDNERGADPPPHPAVLGDRHGSMRTPHHRTPPRIRRHALRNASVYLFLPLRTFVVFAVEDRQPLALDAVLSSVGLL